MKNLNYSKSAVFTTIYLNRVLAWKFDIGPNLQLISVRRWYVPFHLQWNNLYLQQTV